MCSYIIANIKTEGDGSGNVKTEGDGSGNTPKNIEYLKYLCMKDSKKS